jgi:hypothetical protein
VGSCQTRETTGKERNVNVRELPRKVDQLPVVKAVYLGWLSHYATTGGYFCGVITYGEATPGKGKNFHFFVLRTLGLDKPWVRVESDWDLRNGEANAKLEEIEKLAEWPEAEQK